MPLKDYAHWNEDAEYMWWHEEGKHVEEPPAPDDDPWSPPMGAADAFSEELGEMDDVDLWDLSQDTEYLKRWPKAKPLIEWELRYRGMIPA